MTATAVAVAALFELLVGEPPQHLHPVAWLGRLVGGVDRDWTHPRTVGLAVAVVVPLAFGTFVGTSVALAARIDPWIGVLAAGLGLFSTTSLRMLLSEARTVVASSESDLDRARTELRSLAGRDASDLSPGQIRSAAVESAAENLADGLVAPLTLFVAAGVLIQPLGTTAALAAATGAAAWVKAVNTLDSMLGYRSKPVGWAPARLDDLVMWVPARISAFVLAVASGRPTALASARPWLDGVPSPNSGWPMGVLAAVSETRLEKPDVYALNPRARLPSAPTAEAAIRTVGVAGVLTYALAAGILAVMEGSAWF